jgi:hypothetical protein
LNPQLDFQYGRAQGQLASNLAGTDQDGGSTAARDTGDLYQTCRRASGHRQRRGRCKHPAVSNRRQTAILK